MITFKIVPHNNLPGVQIAEVWVGAKMVAVIYPQEPNSIRIISNHLETGPYIEGRGGLPCITRFNFK